MSSQQTLSGDAMDVFTGIQRHLADFQRFGFLPTEQGNRNAESLGTISTFRFGNGYTGMEISLSFLPSIDGHNGGFNVFLIRAGKKRLDLEDFLRKRKRTEALKLFMYRSPEEKASAYVESFLQMLFLAMAGDLKPVLDGVIFEESQVDWAGMK